jgi:hypothetical protein
VLQVARLALERVMLERLSSEPLSAMACAFAASMMQRIVVLLLLQLLVQVRAQPHSGCCLAAATAAASTIYMHMCTIGPSPANITTAHGIMQWRESQLYQPTLSRLTTKGSWAWTDQMGFIIHRKMKRIPKAAHRLQPRAK